MHKPVLLKEIVAALLPKDGEIFVDATLGFAGHTREMLRLAPGLKAIGIETIGQIAAIPLELLIEHFGSSYGQYLYDSSRGINDSPLITHWEAKSVSRETTFQQDVRDWQIIARTLAALARQVVNDLQDGGHRAKTVSIKIRFSEFQTLTRAKTMDDYTDSEEDLRKAAFACLKRIELNKRVRLIGVRASNLDKSTE